MIVRIGSSWLPYNQISSIINEGPVYVAPKKWGNHVQVALASGEVIRLEGVTAEQVAQDINRQIAETLRMGSREPSYMQG